MRLAMACALVAAAWSAQADTGNTAPEKTDAEAEAARVERCLSSAALEAPPDTTVSTLRDWCEQPSPSRRERNEQALRARLALEESSRYNPFVLTPHYRNYLLPVSYWDNPQWNDPDKDGDEIDNYEAKFQISIKTPLRENFLGHGTLYGAFTSVSFWQLYNGRQSKPFRETNYQPEVFVAWPTDFQLGPIDSEIFTFGYMHQSNGQDVPTSRSWERLFVSYVFKAGSYYASIKPWWRIPEKPKDTPDSRTGDDNPDIERYLGHFELGLARPFGNHVAEITVRNNLRSDNKGSVLLDYSFPLTKRFKGLFQAFTGYGDSLINYSDYETRYSVGVLLTDTF